MSVGKNPERNCKNPMCCCTGACFKENSAPEIQLVNQYAPPKETIKDKLISDLFALLGKYHNWHGEIGEVGIPIINKQGNLDYIELNLTQEYGDSSLYEDYYKILNRKPCEI